MPSTARFEPNVRASPCVSTANSISGLYVSMTVMNRLARERSPYLLQHAGNPVDWYPWGDEAFEKARRENKPIFLSIGYSTCHWCHVMEHESFESQEVADALNADFVSIKVDREERPDVDRVYMTFVQSTTGSGGWPMTVFLTPDLKPFFGGTYFPPHSKWGRPGFMDLLGEIGRVWTHDRARVDFAAAELFDRLKSVAGADGRSQAESSIAGPTRWPRRWSSTRWRSTAGNGGFGDSPKFPRPSELLFLLREHARTGAQPPLLMVTETLRAMALGGMRDHVGGGFHRYSVDAEWRVPHFEKMLYDQAQLVLAYLEAAQATGNEFFAAVAEDTLAYVARDMRDAAGGFFSAEDADSVRPPEGGHKDGGPKRGRLLRLERRRDRRPPRRRRRHRPQTLRHRAGRQRAAGPAGGVHRPEPPLYGAVDRGCRGRDRADAEEVVAGARPRAAGPVRRARQAARAPTSTTRCSPPGTG